MANRGNAPHKVKTVHFWHRIVGVFTSVVVILLVITGLLLNHTDELELDRHYVTSDILLDAYDIRIPDNRTSFEAAGVWFSKLGDRFYVNGAETDERLADRNLLGAAFVGNTIVVAVTDRLLLFDTKGELIERLNGAEGVPAGMKRIGLTGNGELVIEASHGHYLPDLERLTWLEEAVSGVIWSEQQRPPDSVSKKMNAAYIGKGLPLERVMVDIHSGRFLGKWGVYIVDAAAVLFLLLAATGVWMWSRRFR